MLLQCVLCGTRTAPAAEPTSPRQEVISDTTPPDELAAATFALFRRRCVGCHGPEKQKGRLRLDSHETLLNRRDEDAVVLPGAPEQSRLLALVRSDGDDRMPPKGPRLAPAEIAAVARWIQAGAPAPRDLPGSAVANQRRRAEPLGSRLGWWELPIVALAASPDGAELAIARGETVTLESPGSHEGAPEGRPRRFLRTARGWVEALAYSPQGDIIALGTDQTVELWSLETAPRHPTRELGPHAEAVTALAFAPDGKHLYAGSGIPTRRGEVRVWNLESDELVRTIEDHTDTVRALAVSPDGKYFASGSADRRILLYNATTGALVQRFFGHSHYVSTLTFAPDSERLYSASVDGEIKEWTFDAPVAQKTLKGHKGEVCAVFWGRDAETIVSAGQDRTVRLWKREDGSALHTFTVAGTAPIHAAALLGNGSVAAVAGRRSVVHLLSTATGTLEGTLGPTRRF